MSEKKTRKRNPDDARGKNVEKPRSICKQFLEAGKKYYYKKAEEQDDDNSSEEEITELQYSDEEIPDEKPKLVRQNAVEEVKEKPKPKKKNPPKPKKPQITEDQIKEMMKKQIEEFQSAKKEETQKIPSTSGLKSITRGAYMLT